MYAIAWGFYLALALGGVLWIGSRTGQIELRLFFDLQRWWLDLGAGVLTAAALWLVWAAAERFLPLARDLESSLRKALGPITRPEAIGLAVLSGFAEEFFFRGAMQAAWGWPIACLLFTLLHTGRDRSFWLWTVFAGVSGLAFAGLTLWCGNLLPAILAHCIFNAINLSQLAPSEP